MIETALLVTSFSIGASIQRKESMGSVGSSITAMDDLWSGRMAAYAIQPEKPSLKDLMTRWRDSDPDEQRTSLATLREGLTRHGLSKRPRFES